MGSEFTLVLKNKVPAKVRNMCYVSDGFISNI